MREVRPGLQGLKASEMVPAMLNCGEQANRGLRQTGETLQHEIRGFRTAENGWYCIRTDRNNHCTPGCS
jgi:hypothetical protein